MSTLIDHPQLMWGCIVLVLALFAAVVYLVVKGFEEFVMWTLGGATFVAFVIWMFSS